MVLTVYFNGQFWVGLVEQAVDGELRAAQHIFGAEPSDGEVLAFVQRELLEVAERSTVGVALAPSPPERSRSPKRAAREAAKAMAQRGASTLAQEAMRLQLEQGKRERQQHSKTAREAEQERRRALALLKAKERHRGH